MEIEIIGRWVWCFNCFAYKDRLKELGFKYAPTKKAWTWHYGDYNRYHKQEVSLDEIRAKYDSQKVNNQAKQKKSEWGGADIFLDSPRAPKGAKSICIHKIRLTQHCRPMISVDQ